MNERRRRKYRRRFHQEAWLYAFLGGVLVGTLVWLALN